MLPEPFYSELYFVFVFLVFVFTSRIWWRLWRLLLDAGSALLYSQFPRSLGVDLGPARLIFGIFCLTYLCILAFCICLHFIFVFVFSYFLHLFPFSLGVDPGWARLEVGHDLARQDFVRLSTGHNFLDPIFGQFVPIG